MGSSYGVGAHIERLGTAASLDAIVIAESRIVEGSMAVARFDPEQSRLDDAIAIGPRGTRPRIARTSRGLAVTWVDSTTGETLLNVLDCCVE